MRDVTVKTKNVRRFDQGVYDLLNRSKGVEGQGVVSGKPGTGKTTALALLANDYDAVYIRALRCSTVTSILGDICKYMGRFKGFQSRAATVDFIVTKLTKGEDGESKPEPRPIMIDECDYFIRQTDILDTLRDIYDLSGCPVILVGEDIAPTLKQNSRFARRLTQWIELSNLDLEDTIKVAQACCEVPIADDLLIHLHQETLGNVGRVKVGLEKIEKFSRANGLDPDPVTLAQWGDRPLYFDQPSYGAPAKGRSK